MKTIYLVEVRTSDTEWNAMTAYETYELAKNATARSLQEDKAMCLSIKFYYRITEIKLFNF